MISNISPCSFNSEDTHNTLKYANRAKEIKTKVTANVTSVSMHVSQYKKIIEEQKEQISELKRLLRAEKGRKEEAAVSKVGISNLAETVGALTAIVESHDKNFKIMLDNGLVSTEIVKSSRAAKTVADTAITRLSAQCRQHAADDMQPSAQPASRPSSDLLSSRAGRRQRSAENVGSSGESRGGSNQRVGGANAGGGRSMSKPLTSRLAAVPTQQSRQSRLPAARQAPRSKPRQAWGKPAAGAAEPLSSVATAVSPTAELSESLPQAMATITATETPAAAVLTDLIEAPAVTSPEAMVTASGGTRQVGEPVPVASTPGGPSSTRSDMETSSAGRSLSGANSSNLKRPGEKRSATRGARVQFKLSDDSSSDSSAALLAAPDTDLDDSSALDPPPKRRRAGEATGPSDGRGDSFFDRLARPKFEHTAVHPVGQYANSQLGATGKGQRAGGQSERALRALGGPAGRQGCAGPGLSTPAKRIIRGTPSKGLAATSNCQGNRFGSTPAADTAERVNRTRNTCDSTMMDMEGSKENAVENANQPPPAITPNSCARALARAAEVAEQLGLTGAMELLNSQLPAESETIAPPAARQLGEPIFPAGRAN